MSDIGTLSDPPPIEPTSAQWWRERMTDLGFWGTVVIVFLVAVVILGQIAGSSGATGKLVATLLLIRGRRAGGAGRSRDRAAPAHSRR